MDKYTILLVDDEPNIVRALKRLFRENHVSILTASSGIEALEVLRNNRVQVIITDNMMPGMTGVEMIREARKMCPDTIRIILSGQSDMDAVLKAVNEGEAYRFILKPWNDIELKVAVNIAPAQYKLTEDNKRLLAQLKEKEIILENLKRHHPELFNSEEHNVMADEVESNQQQTQCQT